jgi:hypothetical protein
MAKVFEKKPVSDHIELQQLSATVDYAKGDFVLVGTSGLCGIADYDTPMGTPGSLDIGKSVAVFQIALSDVATGVPAIGAAVYHHLGTYTIGTFINGDALVGYIIAIGADTLDIAVL